MYIRILQRLRDGRLRMHFLLAVRERGGSAACIFADLIQNALRISIEIKSVRFSYSICGCVDDSNNKCRNVDRVKYSDGVQLTDVPAKEAAIPIANDIAVKDYKNILTSGSAYLILHKRCLGAYGV